MSVSALIPAKGFANAKQRLAPLLGTHKRSMLAEAMLRDVLRQVTLAPGLDSTFVITGDSRVAEVASSAGVEVFREGRERGETEAVVLGLGEMKQRGIQAVLIIPADIPLVRSADIEEIVVQVYRLNPPFALLVPSHDRMGTNGLVLSPPDIIDLRFGYDSFSFHLSQVLAKGLKPFIVENERIALDIDEPRDLERFLYKAIDGEFYRSLLGMGLRPERR